MTYEILIQRLNELNQHLPKERRLFFQKRTRINYPFGHHLFKRMRYLVSLDLSLEELEDGKWQVSSQERGDRLYSYRFTDENEACSYFYVQIKRDILIHLSLQSKDISDRLSAAKVLIDNLKMHGTNVDCYFPHFSGVVYGMGLYGLTKKYTTDFILLCKSTQSFITGGDVILRRKEKYIVTGKGWFSLQKDKEQFRDYMIRTWDNSLDYINHFHDNGECLFLFLVGK